MRHIHFGKMKVHFAALLLYTSLVSALIRPRVALHPAITPSESHWKNSARVPANETIRIDIALSLDGNSSEKAAQAIENISDPNSPSFGQHWSSKQVSELFAPPKEGIRELAKWLTSSGVPRSKLGLSPDRAYLSFDVTVSKAESLLGAKFRRYSSGKVNQTASKVYSLPHDLAKYVDFVLPAPGREPGISAPTSSSVLFKDRLNTRATRKVDCFKYMTPQCLRALYNIDEGDAQPAHPNNSLGVFTPAWSTWLADDMDRFFADFAPDLIGHRPKIIPINGGYQQEEYKIASFNLEPNLDYQYSMALASPVPVTNIQVGDKFLMGNLNTMLGAFDEHYCNTALDPQFDPIYPDLQPGGYNSSDCGMYQPPRVIAIAYAWNEASFSDKYIHRQCLEFLKLGLQGVTVVTGSGDRGPADQLGYCIDPATGNATAEEGHFSSVFPASCPWVTTVGGTQLQNTDNSTWSQGTPFPPETAMNENITNSGGGFSRLFPVPWYQGNMTRAYLSEAEGVAKLAEVGYFNPHGRGYPDLSAVAINYLVQLDGGYRSVKGTSTVVPLIASMIAKINEVRLQAGKNTVGFINPVLYAHRKKILRDVTTGGNEGCGVDEAFPATAAWDAVTGLGSLDYVRLKEVYLDLP